MPYGTGHLEFGDPTEEIVRLATELPADLIVVGHKRQTSLAQVMPTVNDAGSATSIPAASRSRSR